MSMTVQLRVVGIYFRATDLTVTTPTPCVKDVMDAAVAAYPGFGYTEADDTTLKAAFYTHQTDFVSEGGSHRKAGFYFLEDDLGIQPIKTWQWYIVKSDGTVFNFGTGFVPFSLPVADGGYPVQDGDTIIWRLLSILTGPVTPTPRVRVRLNALIQRSGNVAPGTVPEPPATLPIDDAENVGKTAY